MAGNSSAPKRALTRAQALAAGWVEGTDFTVNRGRVTSAVPNTDRTCVRCAKFLRKSRFSSGLFRQCMACEARSAAGVELGSEKERELERVAKNVRKATGVPADPPPPAVIPPAVAQKVSAFQRELAQRTLARRRLLHFIERFHPGYKAGWVHKDICRRLERFMKAVEEGKSPRLLLCLPPRLGKSTIGSQHFPAWMLGHHPDWSVIAASYNISLPAGFSRLIRATLRDPTYQAVFGATRLSDESQAVESWKTTSEGGYIAAGVGTGITGKGCHVLVIDDPIKDMEAAQSLTVRNNTWDWYTPVASTRLAPGGGILGIMTMWHDDDWAGRVQESAAKGGDKFEIVKYPAINEMGDEYLDTRSDEIVYLPPGTKAPAALELLRTVGSALHPERYNLEHLSSIKNNFIASGQARMWSALYQQNPVPDDGAFFKKDMLKYVATPPPRSAGRIFQSWDFSITEKETSDWIVGSCFLQDESDNVFEMDMMRFKVDEDSHAIVDAILDFYSRWGCWLVGLEDGQIFKSLKSLLLRRAQERRIPLNYETLLPLTDKMVRAGPLRGRMQMGKLYFWRGAPFRDVVDNELLRFPGGKHDDIVDSYSWCLRLILAHAPVMPTHMRLERRRREKTVEQKLNQHMRGAQSHMSA